MSTLLDEAEADKAIIGNLIHELRRYKPMQLLKLDDGRVIKVEELVLVSLDELKDREAQFVAELEKVREHIASHPDNKKEAVTDPATAENKADAVITENAEAPAPQPVAQPEAPQVVQPQVVNDVTPPTVQLN